MLQNSCLSMWISHLLHHLTKKLVPSMSVLEVMGNSFYITVNHKPGDESPEVTTFSTVAFVGHNGFLHLSSCDCLVGVIGLHWKHFISLLSFVCDHSLYSTAYVLSNLFYYDWRFTGPARQTYLTILCSITNWAFLKTDTYIHLSFLLLLSC